MQKKSAELQLDQKANEQHELEEAQKQIQTMDAFVRQRLSKEALSRYGNIKTAHPELWLNVLVLLFQQTQKDAQLIEDHQLKSLLQRLQVSRKEFNIKK